MKSILGHCYNNQPLKEALFSDYDGAIKSLGAWGGDFFLATGNSNSINYFKTKGYTTIHSVFRNDFIKKGLNNEPFFYKIILT